MEPDRDNARVVTPAGRSTWTDPAWRSTFIDWATAQVARLGGRVAGPIEQPHVMPWSTVFRIPTDDGPMWGKAMGPGTAHELALLAIVAERHAPSVLAPLVADRSRAWMLLPDGGRTLRQQRPDGTGDHDLAAWERVLAAYAGLQRSLEADADALLDAGVPDGRPEALPSILGRLLDDEAVWDEARSSAEDFLEVGDARARLRRAGAWVADRASMLAGSGIASTLQHDDLHGGNIFVHGPETRFFDWGDASVAHPFGTLTTTSTPSGTGSALSRMDPSSPGSATRTWRPGPTSIRDPS